MDGDNATRFKLHFGSVAVNELPAQNLTIFQAWGNNEVHLNKLMPATVSVYNITSQLLHSVQSGNYETCIIIMNYATGAFVVTVTTADFFVSKKVVLL